MHWTMAASSSSHSWPDKGASALAAHQSTITAILDKLDSADDSKYRNRRQAARVPFRRIDVPIRIYHPGGTVAFKTVAMRNISSIGAGFLYTGFLHIGTRVELMLPRRAGGEDMLTAKVIFCSHVSGSFHQFGVRFEHKITPKAYVDRESLEKFEGGGSSQTTVGGNVLHIDDSEVDRKLLAHYLKSTKIALTSATNADQAIAAVKEAMPDLILLEINLKSMPGEALIGKIREAGYAGRFIVITAETGAERLGAVKRSGATGMLSKPYDQAKLHKLISPFLKRVAADSGVTSTLADQPSMAALIERYVASVQQLAADLESATKDNQLDRIRQICNSLKGSGPSYGFVVLADSAKEAIRSLELTASIQESAAQINKLLDLCKRVIVR